MTHALAPEADQQRGAQALRRVTWAASVAGASIGALALAGWVFDVPVLKRVAPAWAEMKANTAVGLVLVSLALGLTISAPPRPWKARGARLAAGLAAAIGLATLAQQVAGIDLGIDEILFADPPAPGRRGAPGRMAPQTALAFALLGWDLLLGRRPGGVARPFLDAAPTLPVLVIGALGLASYVYAVPPGQGILGFSALPLHTAIALFALAAGSLAARGPSGMLGVLVSETEAGRIARQALPWVVVSPVAVGWLTIEGYRAGIYGVEFGLAGFAVANVSVFAALAWWSARSVGAADAARLQSVAERQLSEEGYRRVFENSPVALYRTTPDGEILDANPALLKLLGYTDRAGLVGGRARGHYVDPAVRDRFRALVDSESVVEGFVAELRRADGSTFWAEDTCAVMRGADGRITHYEGSLVDITARRVAEAQRETSERRFRALIEQSADAIVLMARDGTIIYQSPASEQIFGWGPADLVGRPFHQQVHPEDLHRFVATLRSVMAMPGAVGEISARGLHTNGSWRWVEGVVTNMLDDPDVGALVGNYRDITARREAQEALRESELRFRQMAEHVNEAFFVVDLEASRVLYVSPTWAEIWRRPLAQGYDLAVWAESAHPDDRATLEASLESVKLGNTGTDTFRISRPDNTTAWIRRRMFPVRDMNGRVYRLVGVSEDITELRQAEERFTQAQKLEAVGRLAGGVAHDFNNILTVIIAETELLLQQAPEGSEQHEYLTDIRRASDSAVGLTRQLLAFSRRQLVEPVVLEINDVVDTTSKMLRRLIGEDVTLEAVLAPDAGSVRADRGQLEQVLTNLAVNARDAMPLGGTLHISTERVTLDAAYAATHPDAAAGEHVRLAVRDTGTGMTPEVLQKVFDPFFTTKEAGKGTGLGLATCHGIVRQAGGHIAVESTPGVGTTFFVVLPRVQRSIADAPVAASAVPGGGETVLLVEDEAAVRRVVVRILTSLGYGVLEARSAEEALELFRANADKPDILLTDVVLPGMGGRELAAELVRLRPGLKVLYSSGYTDDVILQHQLMAHDVAVLQKPYSREQLSRKLREVLDRPG